MAEPNLNVCNLPAVISIVCTEYISNHLVYFDLLTLDHMSHSYQMPILGFLFRDFVDFFSSFRVIFLLWIIFKMFKLISVCPFVSAVV